MFNPCSTGQNGISGNEMKGVEKKEEIYSMYSCHKLKKPE